MGFLETCGSKMLKIWKPDWPKPYSMYYGEKSFRHNADYAD
jgi:hypothetical protein